MEHTIHLYFNRLKPIKHVETTAIVHLTIRPEEQNENYHYPLSHPVAP
jgi:hypothetical protein